MECHVHCDWHCHWQRCVFGALHHDSFHRIRAATVPDLGDRRSAQPVWGSDLCGTGSGDARSRRRICLFASGLQPVLGFFVRMDAVLGGQKRFDCHFSSGILRLFDRIYSCTVHSDLGAALAHWTGRKPARDSLWPACSDCAYRVAVRGELCRCPVWRQPSGVRYGGQDAADCRHHSRGSCRRLVFGRGDPAHFAGSLGAKTGIAGFFVAMVSALWAYDGWNNVSMVSSEIREPQRNLPRALILGTAAVIVTYLLVNFAYFYVLSPAQVASSHRVAADMMASVYGRAAASAVTVAVIISILAAINGSILSGARIPYAMARDRLFFAYASSVHPRFQTPGNAMILLCGWACILVLSGWYDDLYNFVIFGEWILYLLTAVSVFVLRRKDPDLPRPYRVLGYPLVPVLFSASALLLLSYTFYNRPRESLMGLSLMGLGVPFYFHWRFKEGVERR